MNTAILRSTPRNLVRLARALCRGELVGVPTETVYGLAADALNESACRRIFAVKGRPTSDPLIVHLASAAQLADVAQPNEAAVTLAKCFWPGPLTMVLPKRATVPDIVTAGLPSVAVRVPAHPAFRKLLRLSGRPLAAPSANRFGYISPTTAEHVRSGLGGKIRYVLDGGPARVGVESTIVDLRQPETPKVLRPGAVSCDALSAALGREVTLGSTKDRRGGEHVGAAQVSPGLLKRHYSPHTLVRLHETLTARHPAQSPRDAWVYLRRPETLPKRANVFWLSRDGNLTAAARRLFAVLRELDEQKFDCIHVELAAEGELAAAINDRLRRAAAR